MNQFTRDIQIDLIMGNKNPIVDTFDDVWEDLRVIELDVYHTDGGEFIYYNSKKEWIFFRDDKNEKFWCHFERYWRIFEDMFKLEYKEIRGLTKILVENALSNTIKTPITDNHLSVLKIETALNNTSTTPFSSGTFISKKVENALSNNITTPCTGDSSTANEVNDALNNTITLPMYTDWSPDSKLENILIATPCTGTSTDKVDKALNGFNLIGYIKHFISNYIYKF